MFTTISNATARLAAIAAAGALAFVPAIGSAQGNFAYAQQESPQVQGRITSIPGKYEIQVRNAQGDLSDVQLHQGTIINPTGITLEPGFSVKIFGYQQGNEIVANEIDTPYNYVQRQAYSPPYPYDGLGYWGNPYWGYPYGTGWWYAPAPIVIIHRP